MNQSEIIKEKIKMQILNIVKKYDRIISTTIVGSFNEAKGLDSISDIDIVIVVDELKEDMYLSIINSFKSIDVFSINLDGYELIINNTFGPLKYNNKNNIVFHVMVYDVLGHQKHVEESPFTCYSWENCAPLLGAPLRDIYPVLNLQLSDIINSRRGLLEYLSDIKSGNISYRKYTFQNGNLIVEKALFKLDEKHKTEYSFHITYHLLNNLFKILNQTSKSESKAILSDFFLGQDKSLNSSISFFKDLYNWKHQSTLKAPKNIINKTVKFIDDIFLFIDKKNNELHSILFVRHQKTAANDGSFLGSRRDPSIIKKIRFNNDSFDIGYCSELKRSKETLSTIDCGMIKITSLLNEIDYGLAEGLKLDELKQQFPYVIDGWKKFEDPCFPEGENQTALLQRVNAFLKQKYIKVNKSIVVTHLVVLRLFLFKFLDLNLSRIFKINISNSESFEIFIFENVYIPNFTTDFRKKIRGQLSIEK